MMSVYKKLMEARIKLQNTKLTKSGNNKFAGYQYFELGDFLPQTQDIFNAIGLCGIVSFGEELATLEIVDVENSEHKIVITSPMKEANLKGCHPIQNLGAVETYTRRYLWVTAMEIVEHDAIDSTTGNDGNEASKPATKAKPIDTKESEDVLQTAAEFGTDTLKKAWAQLSKDMQVALKPKLDSYKAIADKSDLTNKEE